MLLGSDKQLWSIIQSACLSAIFLNALSGPARELVANWTGEYIKHSYPSQFSQRSRKNRAYIPPATADNQMWHANEISFKQVAPLRAPLSEEKSHFGMNAVR